MNGAKGEPTTYGDVAEVIETNMSAAVELSKRVDSLLFHLSGKSTPSSNNPDAGTDVLGMLPQMYSSLNWTQKYMRQAMESLTEISVMLNMDMGQYSEDGRVTEAKGLKSRHAIHDPSE